MLKTVRETKTILFRYFSTRSKNEYHIRTSKWLFPNWIHVFSDGSRKLWTILVGIKFSKDASLNIVFWIETIRKNNIKVEKDKRLSRIIFPRNLDWKSN